jgi:hypothetical protein
VTASLRYGQRRNSESRKIKMGSCRDRGGAGDDFFQMMGLFCVEQCACAATNVAWNILSVGEVDEVVAKDMCISC